MSSADHFHVIGKHFQTARPVHVEVSAGRIVCVDDCDDLHGHASAEPLSWLAPGFIDIQSNGYGGQEFSSPTLTVEQVTALAGLQASFGVTQFYPTVTTASHETIVHAMRTIAQACQRDAHVAYTVPGVHLEGPYLAREDGPRGAHPLEHCRPPDWREFEQFQAAAGGRIRLVTLAVEDPAAPEFIRRATASGVVVAIGHTGANGDQIAAAVDAGARLSTHLGNGAHRTLPRHPNYIWDQMAEDRLCASLIVDGHHLPPAVVRSIVRAKTPQRCILVSDLSGLAGKPPGRYQTELCELEILPDGRLVIAGQGQLLAGASLPIGVGVANVMRFAGVALEQAVHMATLNPARLMGLEPVELIPGNRADLVLFDLVPAAGGAAQLVVRGTVAGGRMFRGGS